MAFLRVRGAPTTSVFVPIGPTDRWLNVAGGTYNTAYIKAYPSAVRMCEASGPSSGR